ncbi:hypothetical protein HPP92_013500 [Vanilla planifolia]|uniref:Uncharacterized protein n=1 Tax=Vanilla planifolia TaxID=51239 RepID=A0A835V0N9_VANPL|nr:hypothetical protein HPP92_013500 [Vanilla planifolia]
MVKIETELNFCPSWIQIFNKELRRTVSFSEHEAFDHPVACLVVVSSKDEHPISRFIDLLNTDQMPSLLNDGAMDPKILKHYLLLHDNHDGTADRASGILAEMKSSFGAADCRLLCINSADGVNGELRDNPWLNSKGHTSASQEIASFLNVDDIFEIKEFMLELSSKHVIPYMEQKIRFLNQQISATRKGFRNQIRNLWWRKGKEDVPETANGPTYTFSSIESQIRVLADYAFMLRDYELALSNYRLLSTDYKLDKAWKHFAGVQEMMGLANFMLDQSRKDSEYCMEAAFNSYLKIGPSGQRNATRCGLWWAEMLKARGQHKEAAARFFRISSEEPPLHAAVMLEQASYCYFFSKPPMLRKYGFHLVLAGNRYFVSDQRLHALRTYRNALLVYKGIPWNYIRDHLYYNIGRWYAFIGIFDASLKHMLEVLACSHQSVTTQDLFLGHFFQTVENLEKTTEVNKLQLPIVNMLSIKVIYEDHRTYSPSTDGKGNENLWQSLEDEMLPPISTIKSNWLESQSRLSLKKFNNSHVCVVGEAIKLELEFRNPLQVPISVFGISLICDLSVKSEETKIDDFASYSAFSDEEELNEPPSCRSRNAASSSLVLSEIDLVLCADETKMVQLDATPRAEGILKILGIRWKLSDVVVGYHYFENNGNKQHKKGKRVTRHSSGKILSFIVIKGLPKLEGFIHNMPGAVLEGDLRLLRLELRNPSEYTVKNMKMAISPPRCLAPGTLEDLHIEFPSCFGRRSPGSIDIPTYFQKSKRLLFSFPSAITIQGGSSIPIIRCVISNSSMSVKVARVTCADGYHEQDKFESFSMQQLSCVGNQWEISSFPAYESICPSKVLHAGQALSCFFKLKDCHQTLDVENKLTIHSCDVSLASHDNSEVPIDVAISPFGEFHQHERFYQGKTTKGFLGNMDFILISLLQQDSSTLFHPSLLSFHACHCSINSTTPIWWLMDGPRIIQHDFSVSFCEVELQLTLSNVLKSEVSIRVVTFDISPESKPSDDLPSHPSAHQGGWYDVPLTVDTKQTPSSSPRSISPFIWCAASSTQVKMQASSTSVVPLRICIFSPGTYDLSNYELHWKSALFVEGLDEDKRSYSGEYVTTEVARRRLRAYDELASTGRLSPALLVVREHLPSGKACLRVNIDATKIGNVARFINHSCDGGNLMSVLVRNSGSLLPRLCFFAAADISRGDELTFSYGDTHLRPNGQPCFCGTAACTGVLPSEET